MRTQRRLFPLHFRYLREIFPDLEKLDGRDLPRRARFDVEIEKPVAQTLPGICPPGYRDVVLNFISQYYKIFDHGNRGDLLPAYNDHAVLTMSSILPNRKRGILFQNCRNLKLDSSDSQLTEKIYKGKFAIIAVLETLMKVNHDLSTMLIDVTFASEKIIVIEVTGFLRDQDSLLCHFSRTFVLVPENNGHTITNDSFYVGVARNAVENLVFKGPQEIVPPRIFGEDKMKEMAAAFSQQTRLKPEWALRCLEENGWNFDVAGQAFLKLRPSIPAEAFIDVPV
ncbi:unnamed protein product [Notodromas monacha]|uniref:Nuclear RNA export factor 1 n=1 Tax=Notodromas monacha TaxID=399045 RepID=A0A7R9BFB4_9CRUS|nr:unnamed protein product [Notodromas monacha]CAG0913055.1 unnamed protein product [Notodromas monacha]